LAFVLGVLLLLALFVTLALSLRRLLRLALLARLLCHDALSLLL
jgi:hypothetical protein